MLIFKLPLAVTPNPLNSSIPLQYFDEGEVVLFDANYGSWITNHNMAGHLYYVNSL
jgi:hypothetical protein